MNSLIGIAILAGLVYAIIIDAAYLKIYGVLVIIYAVITQIGTSTLYNNGCRKSNIATWNAPNNPQILVTFEWDIEKAEEYMKKKQAETGLPITITHLVGYCAGHAFKDEPDVNGRICFGNVSLFLNIVLSKTEC